jgi:hypothetical protein
MSHDVAGWQAGRHSRVLHSSVGVEGIALAQVHCGAQMAPVAGPDLLVGAPTAASRGKRSVPRERCCRSARGGRHPRGRGSPWPGMDPIASFERNSKIVFDIGFDVWCTIALLRMQRQQTGGFQAASFYLDISVRVGL